MKKLLSLITICMITTLCISINSSAATFGDNLTYDKVSNAEIATKTNRFFQEGTIHITNKQEIKEYQESMGLKYDPDVIEIYRHIDVPNENAMIQTLYFGDDYCIKNKNITRKTDKSNVLRQYKRPAGKVKISESVSISNTFSASGGVTSKILNAQLGYNVTKTNKFSISWSNTYKYPVTIKIYPIYSITTGEVWEKDLFFDDHVGNFTAKKAIGDDIVVKQRKTKK